MPGFDVSFLNPKLKTGSNKTYNLSIDQLAIKENQLAADGKLSPGDYGVLIQTAQQIAASPGLTAEQRSNVNVKISEYNQKRSNVSLADTSDISRMNREVNDDFRTITMTGAANPQALLQKRAGVLRGKLQRLNDSIDNLSQSGDDPSGHLNEYSIALNDYNDTLDALDYVTNHKTGTKPASNFVAYITTNANGEINDLQVGRLGSKSGYAETNGLYGGLQIYGKINRKDNGKNIFQLGKNVFSASDYTLPDPQNPGAVKYSPLISEDQQQAMGSSSMKYSTVGTYKDVDATNLVPQTALRAGSWGRGDKGFLYQRDANGRYVKYVNADAAKLGITENDILDLPSAMEAGIVPLVAETVDGSKPFVASPMPTASSKLTPTSTPVAPISLQEALGASPTPSTTSRTKSPTERAPQSALDIAGSLMGKAKNWLGSLWGSD